MSPWAALKAYWWLIRTGLFLALAVAALLYGLSTGRAHGVKEGAAAVAKLREQQDNERVRFALEHAKAMEEQAKRYQTRAEAKAAEADHYRKLYNESNARRDRDVADLNAGNLRLQKQWRGCEARVSQAGRVAPGEPDPDGDTQLRHEGAADLVRNADQCDAWILSLQESARSDRQ